MTTTTHPAPATPDGRTAQMVADEEQVLALTADFTTRDWLAFIEWSTAWYPSTLRQLVQDWMDER